MKKVIFIAGMSGGKRDMYIIKKKLVGFEVIYFPYNVWLNDSITKYSKELKRFIDRLKLKRGEKVGIIGISAGGVIARYYLEFIDNKKVDKLVTVCSPFKGSYFTVLASFFLRKHKGIRDLRKDSKILKKINRKKFNDIKEKNFYCILDILIPGDSGKGLNPEHTWFFFHNIIHWWPPLINKMRKFLE
ncbi:MAG: hypothetical protein WD876_02545 [Candidatus Pacearchaeota archaeon]